MTPSRDEVIRMANEAAMPLRVLSDEYCDAVGLPRGTVGGINGVTIGDVERFGALVAAAEREACAQICDVYAAGADECEYVPKIDSAKYCAEDIRARSAA